MVTISDVATAAGVSPATVSRVMNGHASVDADLAERVRQAASALDYRPSAVARNLRLRQTALWLLMISDIENPFFNLIARGVEDVAQESGYSVVLCNTDENEAKERHYINVARQEQAAGVILSPVSGRTDVSPLLEQNIKVVALDRPIDDARVDCVLTDSEKGACDAAKHLLEQGWQSISCITGRLGAGTAEARAQGYRKAIEQAGRAAHVYYSDFRTPGGRAAAARLLDSDHRPDALFVANNLMAVGALQELAARGLRPGVDVGVAAFDDPPWATLLDPPLTCVAQPSYKIGRHAASLLASRLAARGKRPPVVDMLQPTLLIRRSSLRT